MIKTKIILLIALSLLFVSCGEDYVVSQEPRLIKGEQTLITEIIYNCKDCFINEPSETVWIRIDRYTAENLDSLSNVREKEAQILCEKFNK